MTESARRSRTYWHLSPTRLPKVANNTACNGKRMLIITRQMVSHTALGRMPHPASTRRLVDRCSRCGLA